MDPIDEGWTQAGILGTYPKSVWHTGAAVAPEDEFIQWDA